MTSSHPPDTEKKEGFYIYEYNGIEIKPRDFVPEGELWAVDKKGKVTRIDIHTGKVIKGNKDLIQKAMPNFKIEL